MDETRITQIPPGAVQEMSGDDVRTNEEAVEAMAILGEEHVEAVASMGAAEAREETEEDECRLEQSGNDSDDGERSDQLEPVQESVDADPERDGQEDQPDEDSGSGVPEDGVAEEPGEVPANEQGAEAPGPQEPVPENQDAASEGLEEADSTAAVAADEAAKKLKGWKQANKHPYTTLICDHLIKRCREDAGFAQDVLKESKVWDKCFGFIKEKARSRASAGVACIEDREVYEWAEDYIRNEEKVESQKAAKTAKKTRKRNKNAHPDNENAHSAPENAHSASENADPATEKASPESAGAEAKPEVPARKSKKPGERPKAGTQDPKPEKPKKEKKDKGEMEGQIDLFSLFG